MCDVEDYVYEESSEGEEEGEEDALNFSSDEVRTKDRV